MKTIKRQKASKGGWTLKLLGEPALVSPEGREHLLERRAAALLALAALDPGIARRRVAHLLWPDSEEATARQALRQQLLRLKKLAGEVLEPGEALHLASAVATDIDAHDRAGVLLGSLDYGEEDELAQWVSRERERRQGAIVQGLVESLGRAEARSDWTAAVEIALRLIEVDPANESHHRTLMRLHYLGGDVARAQEAYARLKDMLQREFAATPSPETEKLASTLRSAGTAVATRSRIPPASLLRPPRLIGREAAWQSLDDCWRESMPAVVSAVAGMGKTRLVTDFAASVGATLMITARPGDALAADSVLARLARALFSHVGASLGTGLRAQLAHLLPELAETRSAGNAPDRGRLLRAVESTIDMALSAGTTGIVFDDLHYADDASLESLQVLAGHGRMRMVFTFRDDEMRAAGRALVDALLGSGVARHVELAPLEEPQVAELIDSLELPGIDANALAPRIAKHTGGSPLFILETLKALTIEGASGATPRSLPVASNVRELIARRLTKLSLPALSLARCAAIAGQDASAELACHVMGVRPIELADAWSELENAHVFRDGAFDHDLIQEAALASVPAAIGRRLHAQVAAFLEGTATEPARVAHHWVAARHPKEAADAFVRAAGRAHEGGRRNEEAALLGEAAACFAQVGDNDARFEALVSRAEAMLCDDLGEATQAAVDAALGAARTDAQRLRALLCEAEYRSNGSADDGIALGNRGRLLAEGLGNKDVAIRFAAIAASGLCALRRVDDAIELLAPHREAVGTLPPRTVVEYLIQLGIAYDLANRLGEALRAFDEARVIAAEHGLKDLLAMALSNLATTTSKRGGLSRAVEYGRQALQLWREAEPLKGIPMQTQTLLAHRLRDIGHYHEAIEMFEEALAEFRRAGARAWVFAGAHRLALAYAYVGQHARAIKLLADDPHDLPLKVRAIWEAHRGEVARLAGGEGLAPMRAAMAMLGTEVDDGNNRLVGLLASSMLPAAEGESTAAAVAAWATARERYGMALAAHTRAAACALAQGAIDRSVAQVEAALRLASDYEPDNFYRAELWWVGSQALLAADRVAESDRLLAQGRDWILATAASHVRAEFRDSFLHRNPINRALLAATHRRLPAP